MFPLPSILSLYQKPRCQFFGLVSQSRRVTLLTSSYNKSCTMLNHSDVNMSHLPCMQHIAKPFACFGCSMSRLCMESRHVEVISQNKLSRSHVLLTVYSKFCHQFVRISRAMSYNYKSHETICSVFFLSQTERF